MRFVFSEEEDKNLRKSRLLFCTLCDIFIRMQLLFDMFSIVMSIELKLKTENFLMYGYNAGPPMAILIYTVLPHCVILLQDLSAPCYSRCASNIHTVV